MVLRGTEGGGGEEEEWKYVEHVCLVYLTVTVSSAPVEGGSSTHNSRELSRHSHHHQLPHTSDLEGNDPGVPRIGPVHLQKRKVQDLPLPVG